MKVSTNTFGLSRLDLLERDKKAGLSFDGMLSMTEARTVAQLQLDQAQRGDAFARARYRESEQLIRDMGAKGVTEINYLPPGLRDVGTSGDGKVINLRLRFRATEMLDAAYRINGRGGAITQPVVDHVADIYKQKRAEDDITSKTLDETLDEIDLIVEHLNMVENTGLQTTLR